MVTRRQVAIGAGGLVVVLGSGAVIREWFFPERATAVDEGALTDDAMVVKSGTFTGKAGHEVSGRVSLVQDDDGFALRFEEYEQTQGPDVYVYLTPDEDPDTTAEIEAGIRVPIDGGAGSGESTKEGTFAQRIEDPLDPDEFNGVGIWCDRFSVPFGSAPLRARG